MNAPNDKPTPTTDASNETVSYTRPLVASHLSATDSGRGTTSRSGLRPHPYLRTMPTRSHADPLNNPLTVLASRNKNFPIFDIRRRHYILPLPPRVPGQMPMLLRPRMHISAAHLSPPQHVRLDAKEMQRQRLVRLFKIPEFFAVVREGWGDALKEESEEKQASASASSSIKEPKHLDDSSNTN